MNQETNEESGYVGFSAPWPSISAVFRKAAEDLETRTAASRRRYLLSELEIMHEWGIREDLISIAPN